MGIESFLVLGGWGAHAATAASAVARQGSGVTCSSNLAMRVLMFSQLNRRLSAVLPQPQNGLLLGGISKYKAHEESNRGEGEYRLATGTSRMRTK